MATPPDFTTGQVLTAAQMNAVGLWLVKSQTIGTAVSSVTVTSAFLSDYEAYEIVITGGAGSTTQGLNLTFGSTSTGYYMQRSYVDWATATYVDTSVSNGASFITAGAFTSTTISFSCRVINPNLSARTIVEGKFVTAVAGGEGQSFNGFLNDTTQYTSFTLTTGAGTLTGGTIRVYGYRK